MATKKACDEVFIQGAIHSVAEVGIENMRTKDVADYAGFSEATLFRHFATKEELLRCTFLYVDKKISDIFTHSRHLHSPEDVPLELAAYAIWQKIYRYLIDNREQTIFLIRYRYSSLYTEEVRMQREAYNGSFEHAYEVIDKRLGSWQHSYKGFIINYIFEMTMCFAEKVIAQRVMDIPETERRIWLAISSAAKAITAMDQGATATTT